MKPTSRQRGYVLIELLVTVVIIAGGILFVVDSIRQSSKVARRLIRVEQAAGVAQEAFDALVANPGRFKDCSVGEKEVAGITYHWEVTTGDLLHLPCLTSPIRAMTVTVDWNDGRDYNIELPFVWSPPPG